MIKKLKAHFSRHGVPVKFLTDNARQLVSDDFEHFMRSWKCKHVTSSPYHPKGNATAEASVKTAKSLMRKSRDAHAALLTCRKMPKPDIGLSPAQLFLMRRMRTSLPTSSTLLVPKITKPPPAKVHQREHCIKNYDCHAKALQTLHTGDSVRIKPVLPNQKKWEKGTITKKLDHRSYEVQPENGQTTHRNRVDLRPAETPTPEITKDITPDQSTTPRTRYGRVIKSVQRLGFD